MAGNYETQLAELCTRKKWGPPRFVRWPGIQGKYVYELYVGDEEFRGELTEGDENARENVAQMACEKLLGKKG